MTAAADTIDVLVMGKTACGKTRLRTETTPISQTTGNDYALPKVTRDVADLTDDKAKKQTEDAIDECD